MKKKLCLGYGDTEGICSNQPNRPRSLYWCAECDQKRMAKITEQLNAIAKSFE